jgi:hypothetical protein
MGKQRDLSLETYIEKTTTNIEEDRAMAKSLLIDVMTDMKEQLVKLAAILQRQKTNQVGLTEDDKEQLFDILNENKEDG